MHILEGPAPSSSNPAHGPINVKVSISHDYKLTTSPNSSFYTQTGLINISGNVAKEEKVSRPQTTPTLQNHPFTHTHTHTHTQTQTEVTIKEIAGFPNLIHNVNNLTSLEDADVYSCALSPSPKSILKFSGGEDYNFVRVLKKISFKEGNLKVRMLLSE